MIASKLNALANAITERSLCETVSQVAREYSDRFENIVYSQWAKIRRRKMKRTAIIKARHDIVNEIYNLIKELSGNAFAEGMREGGVANPEEEMDHEDRTIIANWILTQGTYLPNFASDAAMAWDSLQARNAIINRIDLWVASLSSLGDQGRASAQRNMMVTWFVDPQKEHCVTCVGLHKKRHRLKWFTSRGYIPQQPASDGLACGGWR